MKRSATLAGLVLLALCLMGTSSAAGLPRPGSLDPSFGNGGVVTYTPGNDAYASIRGIAVQPDGKIVVAGSHLLARYLPNGSPDPSFGTGGYVRTATSDNLTAEALQPDGKIVVAGTRYSDPYGESSTFMVARYNPDGSLDTGFGNHGVATTDVYAHGALDRWETPSAVAVLPGGRIVAAGTTEEDPDTGPTLFSLVRYTPHGSLDPTFHSGGIVSTGFTGWDVLGGIVVLPSGKIVATGAGFGEGHGDDTNAMVLARYESDGSLDRSFGMRGKVVIAPAGGYNGGPPALQSGKIVVAGFYGGGYRIDPVLARFNADGRLDTTFGTAGFALLPHVSAGPCCAIPYNGVVVQPDGKILLSTEASVVQLTPNGRRDQTFGSHGGVHVSTLVQSVALQADRKILVGGGSAGSWTLARLRGNTDCIVPRVSRETIAEATAALQKSHCTRGVVGWYPSSTMPRGHVLYTVPAAGTDHRRAYAVELVVSEGKP